MPTSRRAFSLWARTYRTADNARCDRRVEPTVPRRMIARLSDLAYTRLYGRDRTCTGCGRDYGQDSTRCPNCKSPASTLTDRTAPVGSRPC